MARYRKIDVRIHFDRRVQNLSPIPPCGEGLWHYLLTNPDGTMVPGLARCGRAAMAEALGWELEDFDKAFEEIVREGLAKADWKERVVWVPNVINYDPPSNPNVVKGWAQHWDEIPECDLKADAWESLWSWFDGDVAGKSLNQKVQNPKAFMEAFLEACPNPSAKGSAKGSVKGSRKSSSKGSAKGSVNALAKPSRARALRKQEQEQEQEQEQIQEEGRGSAEGEPVAEPQLFAPASGATNKRAGPSLKEIEAEFEQWWAQNPKKVGGKKAALELWVRKRRSGALPSLERMLERLELHKATPRWREGTVPDPRTYLHQERWEDDPAGMTAVRSNGGGRDQAPALPFPTSTDLTPYELAYDARLLAIKANRELALGPQIDAAEDRGDSQGLRQMIRTLKAEAAAC